MYGLQLGSGGRNSTRFAFGLAEYIGMRTAAERLRLGPGWEAVALVKPQFEAGREEVGKHGIVSDPATFNQLLAHCTTVWLQAAPDQVGWGESSKPDLKYSFEMLASNNKLLLDSLGIKKICLRV